MSFQRMVVSGVLALVMTVSSVSGEIEAVKGKRYPLSKQHGPWMVMVAAIRDVEEEGRRTEGLSARQAADQLVYELRCQGIPAYTYSLDRELGEVAAPTLQESSSRRFVAQHGYISVLAGNFKSSTDKDAVRVLNYIKGTKKGLSGKGGFSPKFLTDEKNGGILPSTPGRPSPLSRAFLTVNPLWEGEVRTGEEQDLIHELNVGQKYSLLKNPGKYSLIVATFAGNSVMQVSNSTDAKALSFFEKNFGGSLDDCAENAIVLADRLRHAKEHGYETNYEAWVFHDRYRSFVTIGSFNSPEDPRIRTLVTQFSIKTVRHPQTGEDVQVAEIFSVPRMPKASERAQTWLFDANPRIIAVPKH
jgi:hypothetical protein